MYQLSVGWWHRQGRGPLGEPTKRALINAMDRLVNEFRYGHLGLKDLLVRRHSTFDTVLLKNIAKVQSVQPSIVKRPQLARYGDRAKQLDTRRLSPLRN